MSFIKKYCYSQLNGIQVLVCDDLPKMVILWHQGDLLNEHLLHSLGIDQFSQVLITGKKIRKMKEYGMTNSHLGKKIQ